MSYITYIFASVIETFLRLFPFPTRTGLVSIGNPDRNSPVLLTCNFHLTVLRVKKQLKGIDAFLLIANSRGINVWCAATGGLLTNHDVISVLKTSGIEQLVQHRNVILPQLSGTGIEPRTIGEKAGWKVVFGPIYIEDIRDFLSTGKKSESMRKVRFDIIQRLEMAVAWAFPLSIVPAIIMLPFWPNIVPPLIAIIWILSLLIFLPFPFYSRWLNPKRKRIGLILFDFKQGGFLLILWGLFFIGLIIYSIVVEGLNWGFVAGWGIGSFAIILLLSLDLMGSTPQYKSSLHDDRLLTIDLDQSKCHGAGSCLDVCPRGCFQVDRQKHTATVHQARFCIQCGACIVQCPFDALSFHSSDGEVILPQTIRKYKLNLMGKRVSNLS